MKMNLAAVLAGAAGMVGTILSAQAADTVQDFYKGKQVSIVVGGDAGGAHDAFARVLARHFSRHIPGNPTIVVQNMPGAGGVAAANHMANVAPQDGTVVAALYPANVIQPVLENNKNLNYDPRKMLWIGSIDTLQIACFTGQKSAVRSVSDARGREVVVGSGSPVSSSSVLPNIMNRLIGTKFKVITGYSTGDLVLALERGEIEGICGWAYTTILQTQPKWITEKQLHFLAQSGISKIADLPQVPMVVDFVDNPDDKAALKLLDMRTALGRPYVAPPNVPKDRIAALRAAFDSTMKDPAYLADAKKAKQDISYTDYKGMEQLVADAYGMPASVVKRAIDLSKPPAAN